VDAYNRQKETSVAEHTQ